MKQTLSSLENELIRRIEQIRQGGDAKHHEKNAAQGKLFVRERLRLLLDEDSCFEDGLFARWEDQLAADAVVTVVGKIQGRTVCVIANDSTVKAGTWGRTTIEKIIRMQETAQRMQVPLIYMVDSAGARLDEQFDLFMDRRHAGRIFYNQIHLSGVIPQICILFGPSPAGAAYLPAFCDVVLMVDGNASAYIGSPRMAEMAIGERISMEDLGGARMHCSISGLGDILVRSEQEAIEKTKQYLSYFPQNWKGKPEKIAPRPPRSRKRISEIVPAEQNKPFDMAELIEALVDEDSFFEMKPLFAKEIIVGFARIGGRAIGVVANQPMHKGGVLFVDTADKAAHFIWLCNAFNIPLLFLQDISGFMLGSTVERQGIIRHGAKMLFAVAQATVPRISVIVRKAYGAGYMAMSGASMQPDACIALASAKPAIMGPESAINAIYYNTIKELESEERRRFVEEKRREYEKNIDIYKVASEYYIDAVIPGDCLRQELIYRFEAYENKVELPTQRKNPVLRG